MPAPATCPTSGLADYYQVNANDLAAIVACSTCNNAAGGAPDWNGTLGPGSGCTWAAYSAESGTAMDGKALNPGGCLIQLDTGARKWTLQIRCYQGVMGRLIWYGEKGDGDTPEGIYTRVSGTAGGCSTDPATVTVGFIPIVAAWPGGQADTALNPTETFASSDFGFSGNVDWNVGAGSVDGLITETGGTTATARSTITVRYDTVSPSSAEGDAVLIQATSAGVTRTRKRIVFKADWTTLNFTNTVDADNNLRFPADTGTATNKAELNWDGDSGATRVAAKMEAILSLQPAVDWTARGVKFIFSTEAGSKFRFRVHRQVIAQDLDQSTTGANRGIGFNFADWAYDGDSDPGDAQYPTAAKPSKAFRIDSPGWDAESFKQFALRADFREIAEWHNGSSWLRVTPYTPAQWHADLTGVLPNDVRANPTADGSGNPFTLAPNTQPVANAGPDQPVATGAQVTLDGSASSDADNDSLTYKWTQTGGPAVALSSDTAQKPTFTAPNAPATLTFQLKVMDVTQGLLHHKPTNSESAGDAVVITVQ